MGDIWKSKHPNTSMESPLKECNKQGEINKEDRM